MSIRGIAHRGFPTKYPENTISSFQAALDASFTHMELDVHLSKDGIPVIMHDPTINRMCNGEGRISDYTLEELKQFTIAGIETIPTLEEVFRLVKGRITVLVELKRGSELYEGLENKVLAVANKLDMTEQLIITSFEHQTLINMRELNQDISIGLLRGGASAVDSLELVNTRAFNFMQEINARYTSIPITQLTHEYAQTCQDNGIQLIVRPIDTEEAMMKMLQYPVVLASTNELEKWQRFFEQHRLQLQ